MAKINGLLGQDRFEAKVTDEIGLGLRGKVELALFHPGKNAYLTPRFSSGETMLISATNKIPGKHTVEFTTNELAELFGSQLNNPLSVTDFTEGKLNLVGIILLVGETGHDVGVRVLGEIPITITLDARCASHSMATPPRAFAEAGAIRRLPMTSDSPADFDAVQVSAIGLLSH